MNKSSRLLATLIVIIVIIVAAWYFLVSRGALPGSTIKDSGSNISDYSAVFLTNGQVYFGKLDKLTDTEVDIKDIYYLQVNQQNLQPADSKTPAASASPDISLVKLGNELHGPNDRMRINRQQVLFTESLKSDSKVVKAIADFASKK
jgi:hypothetical protein